MRLTFEQSAELGSGVSPQVLHLPDNTVWPWDDPKFGDTMIATADKEISKMRIKNIPRVGAFGAWHQEEVLINGKIVSPERQRFGIWDAINDITNFLESGSIQFDLNNIVSQASFTFKNPFNRLAGESASRLTPGNKIELFFTAGDSDDYPMGVFYADRVTMETYGETANVECRNISGKILKDQKMNGQYSYPKDVYAYVVEDFLAKTGVPSFNIQQPPNPETAWQLGMVFPPDMDRLTALNELIRSSLNWVLRETLDGQIVAGSEVSYPPIVNMVSRYEFDRTDLITRRVERDDMDVYSTVCYQAKDTATEATIRRYVKVNHALDWSIAPHKTLYVTAPDDTPEGELLEHAEELAERIGYAGIIETFTGPFRPYLVPGDEAEISGADGVKLLGTITTVFHSFGVDGFFTEFAVDSGGAKGKPQLKDLINQAGKSRDESIKRII